ncbi:MAG: radical SAM enzyme (TIGR01210 family) [Rhodothermales bacterium]
MIELAPDDAAIRAARGPKTPVDPRRPYALHVEPERSRGGRIEDIATVFLTNRECPFTCLMCDLWTHTMDHSVSPGDILEQLDFALAELPPTRHIKLYNAGNFFDAKAIPKKDRAALAGRLREFETVVIENHPSLCGPAVTEFASLLSGELEVAMGLETVHPEVLPRLNKQMTAADFRAASEWLVARGVSVRAFVLLRPPFLTEREAVEWALKSVEFALESGADVCSIIPTRGGNGIMERLAAKGAFAPPQLASLEEAQLRGLQLRGLEGAGSRRVFVDLWDAPQLEACPSCGPARIERMRAMNHTQIARKPALCMCQQRQGMS